jgi:hypothetical protein
MKRLRQVFIALMVPSANTKLRNRLPWPLCGQNRKNNSEFFSFSVLIYIYCLKITENLSQERAIFFFHSTTLANGLVPVGQMKNFWNSWITRFWEKILDALPWNSHSGVAEYSDILTCDAVSVADSRGFKGRRFLAFKSRVDQAVTSQKTWILKISNEFPKVDTTAVLRTDHCMR